MLKIGSTRPGPVQQIIRTKPLFHLNEDFVTVNIFTSAVFRTLLVPVSETVCIN